MTTLTNNPSPFAAIAHENILAYAKDALKALTGVDITKGKAQQKLCACVLAQHERDTETPPDLRVLPNGVPALSTLAGDSKIATEYRAYLKLFFVGTFDETGANVSKKGYANEDAKNNAKRAWSKRNTLLQNAIKLAVALMGASGGVVKYDHAAAMFSVHPLMLLPKDGEAIGQLAKLVTDGATVPLDNAAWRYEQASPNKTVTIQASIAQVVRAHESRMGVVKSKSTASNETGDNDNDNDSGEASKASGPKIDEKDMSFDDHIIAAHKIIAAGGALKRNWLTDEGWNAMVAIVAEYDNIQEPDLASRAA